MRLDTHLGVAAYADAMRGTGQQQGSALAPLQCTASRANAPARPHSLLLPARLPPLQSPTVNLHPGRHNGCP